MRKLLVILVAVLLTGACGDGATDVDAPAKVRFFNVVWNAPDGIGFTANTQFAAGSALKYAQSSQTCSSLDAASTTFGIGIPNASGTALNGPTIVTLDNQTIANGGNYTILAGGNVVHPSVIMLDNSFSGTLGSNQAAVRFVNLAANAGAATNPAPFKVVKGTSASGTVVQDNIGFRGATPFSTVTSGSNAYTIMQGSETVVSGNAATLNLQGGTVNTVVIIRSLSGGNDTQLITVPSCS